MATQVIIPHFGTSVDRVILVQWLKEEGEPVARGDVLCEIETDKAVSELESFAEGVLLKRMVDAGADVQIGSVIAYVGRPGEEVPAGENEVKMLEPPSQKEIYVEKEEHVSGRRPEIKASPKVRRFAKNSGVDLSEVKPTGRDGRITEDDVRGMSEGLRVSQDVAVTETPLSQNQLAVIRRISRSQKEIVPINLAGRINMKNAIANHRELREESDQKISFDAIFICAVSRAMKEFPDFLCYFNNDKLFCVKQVNVGLAVSTEDNLYVPVVRNADSKSLREIDGEIRAFVEKAQKTGLAPDDISGATFTISNLGMFPVESFNAVIPPEQSGALAVGCIRPEPVFKDYRIISAEPMMRVVLSVDHRIINGRLAGEFLGRIIRIIEEDELA